MAEDQVVVGDEVEEPHIQLLCIVALRIKNRHEGWLELMLLKGLLRKSVADGGPRLPRAQKNKLHLTNGETFILHSGG